MGEMDYVNNIKSTILEMVNQYESDETVDEVLLWEMIKLLIIYKQQFLRSDWLRTCQLIPN